MIAHPFTHPTHVTPSFGATVRASVGKELKHRATRGIQHYVFDHHAPAKWKGHVERRDPASYRMQSIHLTWRCGGCRQWTMNGAYLRARCNWCDHSRGDT